MGREATCFVQSGGERTKRKVLCESEELILAGRPRVRIPFASVTRARVAGLALVVEHAGGAVSLELGAAEAAKWQERITKPRGLFEKLGVAAGQRARVAGAFDASFVAELEARTGARAAGQGAKELDLVFLGVEAAPELDALLRARGSLAPAGAVWVVWPKGRAALKEDHVRAAALAAGLVDVKVASFSPTHCALKLVIPKKCR